LRDAQALQGKGPGVVVRDWLRSVGHHRTMEHG
jgi:hypothetical protein